MSIEVKVPVLPESVADATIATWHKKKGDRITREENLVDLETDKVILEVPSPIDGVVQEIYFKEGDTVKAQQLLARIEQGTENTLDLPAKKIPIDKDVVTPTSSLAQSTSSQEVSTEPKVEEVMSPAVRRMLTEYNLNPKQIVGSGKSGRLTKDDVLNYIKIQREKSNSNLPTEIETQGLTNMDREERRVPMTRLRAKIAERLLAAQHNAAILTTFNEINLKAIKDLRAQYKDTFEKAHGVKLGFMSFFAKAVVEALALFPAVNASIDGDDIVYHGYYDLGIAVSTERGLVVPVLRDVDAMGLAQIEKSIGNFATKARDGKLAMEDMQGGTFTITNGGVFGSLLATPIINPPQTAILGMHKIEDRPIAENGQVVIRPMMYVALSYDHRLIDGKESVQFLVKIKELLEDPARLLLKI